MAEPSERPLRLMVYDRTHRGRGPLPGLSHVWGLGATWFSLLRRFDATIGVSSWDEAWAWLAAVAPGRRIAEVQYWGHGKWGSPRIHGQSLREDCLLRDHEMCAAIDAVTARMLPGDEGLFWLRTCESFGATSGQRLAAALADRFGCRAAGHTFIIGHIQSGLHSVLPGETPTWAPDEALLEGTPDTPLRAAWSRLRAPNTIHFLTNKLPRGY